MLDAVAAVVVQEPAAVPVLRPAPRVVGRVVVVAVDRAVHDRHAAVDRVRAQRRRRARRSSARRRRRARAGSRAAVRRRRVAAAVPDVAPAHLARVHPGAGLVRELARPVLLASRCEVVAVVPAVGAARRGAAGHVAGRVRRPLRPVGEPVAVGLPVAHAVGPAVVAGAVICAALSYVDGPSAALGRAGVRADPGRVRDVGLRVDREPRRVAQAHHVDLGPRLAAAALVAVEQVRPVR